MPYWDQTSDDSRTNGIPWALTKSRVVLDGEEIDNPLRSFVFPKAIHDHVSGGDADYSKPAEYETVRYPLSGLVGTDKHRKATDKHNAPYYKHPGRAVELLNKNITNWLERHRRDQQHADYGGQGGRQVLGLPAGNPTTRSSRTRPQRASGTTITPMRASSGSSHHTTASTSR